jgi:hypothetical protein
MRRSTNARAAAVKTFDFRVIAHPGYTGSSVSSTIVVETAMVNIFGPPRLRRAGSMVQLKPEAAFPLARPPKSPLCSNSSRA